MKSPCLIVVQKAYTLIASLQIAQLILFLLPVLALVGMGAVILTRQVCVIHQRWYLAVLLPLLFATLLSLLENFLADGSARIIDWRFWLALATDVFLVILVIILFRGWAVFGLTMDAVCDTATKMLSKQDARVTVTEEHRRNFWGSLSRRLIVEVSGMRETEKIWIIDRFQEVVLKASSRQVVPLVRNLLPELQNADPSYDFGRRTVGILYILLGAVLAVFGWIFFFEPRLILV